MIICKINVCPFNAAGSCEAPLVSIDDQGRCEHIFRKGVVRADWQNPVDDIYKKKILILDAEEVKDDECSTDGNDGTSTEDANQDA